MLLSWDFIFKNGKKLPGPQFIVPDEPIHASKSGWPDNTFKKIPCTITTALTQCSVIQYSIIGCTIFTKIFSINGCTYIVHNLFLKNNIITKVMYSCWESNWKRSIIWSINYNITIQNNISAKIPVFFTFCNVI